MKHLRLDLYAVNKHAQIIMKDYGITYQYATPQSIGHQWWFWNCENIPTPLPKGFSVLELDPMDQIGWGLSKEDAESIRGYNQSPPSSHNSDYAKCSRDLIDLNNDGDEWSEQGIIEILKKHFA